MKLALIVAAFIGAVAFGTLATSKDECEPFAIGSVIELYC